ncbi:peptidoglycan DD-metalloendopeptidase family protein [Fictibacillus sp. b24]|uniref:peptidoglycan DD-metalloendopeptidase family protein n=1 Tax=Fictibacillus sp. b24 TaxID=3055863 RepID=UPI0025A0BAEC|nr:peptidoglycan DD-metalloendopeptidase family protein [Fictibacillus sp. b24]MDM5314499.1 peptidoglycan DD-metalloendopeptidase family protein [Fictibacillus sp. b24]
MQNRKTTEVFKNKIIPLFIAVLMILSTFTLNPSIADAHHDDNHLIKTVFNVYVDGKKIGTVREESVVENTVEEILQQAKGRKSNFAFTINESIELKPEKMFRPQFDNEAAREALRDRLSVSVEAYRLVVGGQTVAYVSSEKEAEDTLLKLQLEHVSKAELDEIQKKKAENKELEVPKLSPGESKVVDIDFSTPIFIQKAQTSIKDLVSVDGAISLLKEGTIQEKEHVVQKGETVKSIAEKYHLTMEQFYTLNKELLLVPVIRPGQAVTVTEKKPYTEVMVYEATRVQNEIPFQVEKQEDSTLEKGQVKTVQKGQKGLEDITYTVRKADDKVLKKDTVKQETVKAPVTEIQKIGTKVIPSKGTGTLSWPAVGGYISSHKGSRWGRQHKGMDIARPSERSILAADNGTVASAGWDGDYGNKIIINHNNGMKTIYAHLNSISVSTGDVVQKGSKIGVMGSTGQSTGVHLHFEVYENGVLKNPADYIKK